MKKIEFKKIAAFLTVAITLLIVLAMALLIYIPAFTAYADSEEETVTTRCIKVAASDLEHNAYSKASGIQVKDLDTDNVVFYLPESYFLTNVEYRKIARFDFEYYSFSYAGLDTSKWYIDYSDSLVVDTVTFSANENPFPDVTLSLVDNGAVIYLDNDTILTNDFIIKFIGFDQTGEEFYVSATKDGVTKYAMVSKSLFTDSSIPYQARTQTEREALLKEIASTPKPGDIVPNTSRALRIIIIVAICISAALLIIVLFLPKKGAGQKGMARERSRDEFDYDARRDYQNDNRYYQDDNRPRDDRRY